MKVYVAARMEDRLQAAEIQRDLEAAEIEVLSDWIELEGKSPLDHSDDDETRRRAGLDLQQVAEVDVLVLFKPLDGHRNTTGGHHVETGYALALGKPVFLIGSRENVFHWHPSVREFDSTQAAIVAINSLKPEDFSVSPHSADSYQRWTRTTAVYPGKGDKKALGVAYTAVGLGGEAGEAIGKVLSHLIGEQERLLVKGGVETEAETIALTNLGLVIEKLHYFAVVAHQLEELKRPMREGKLPLPDLAPLPEELLAETCAEIGDVQWYLARLADEAGASLSAILTGNVAKLMSRKNRGVIHGTGDNR